MAVASAAKMVLLSGSLLDSWRQVGLDWFNDDTCPLGHISRPTQVDVSQSCSHFPNKLLKSHYIVQGWGPVEVNKLHHIR